MRCIGIMASGSSKPSLRFHRRPQLKLGSKGEYVRELQTLLNDVGLSIVVDGLFGIETEAAVKDAQQASKSLLDDGIVGPLTWALLLGVSPGDLRAQIRGTRAIVGYWDRRRINEELDKKIKEEEVVTAAAVVHARTHGVDSYAARLIKYIPSEIIAVYLTLRSMIMSSEPQCHSDMYWAYWAIFIFGVIVTPIYMWKIQRRLTPGKIVNKGVVLVSTGAFIAWTIGSAWPFELCDWYQPVYGGMFLIVYTFLMPLFEA